MSIPSTQTTLFPTNRKQNFTWFLADATEYVQDESVTSGPTRE